MPYNGKDDDGLPGSVKHLPDAMRALWVRVFNENYDSDDEAKAFKIAWSVVRKVQTVKGAKAMSTIMPDMDDVRAWLYGEKATKTDGGLRFSASAYLHVPDGEKPSTWKLRIEERPGEITVAQLGRAAAALSSKGFMGNPTHGISDSERKSYASKLIAIYRRNDIDDKDIPEYLFAIADMKQRGSKSAALQAGFKVLLGNDGAKRWVMISSGAFEDREGEIISTEFLTSALEFAEKHGRGTLNFWHIPGTDIGTCDFQALVGEPPLLLESGIFDDTPAGRSAAQYCEKHAPDLGGSLEFLYKRRTPDGVYQAPGVIVRRSILPLSRAAFPWSACEVVTKTRGQDMKTRNDIIAEFAQLIGVEPDQAEKILAHIESGSKTLKDYGIRWKETDDAADPQQEPSDSDAAPTLSEPEPILEAAEKSTDITEVIEAQSATEENPQEQAGDDAPLEVILDENALSAVVNQVVAQVDVALQPMRAQITALSEQILALLPVQTAVKELQTVIAALKTTDEEKIAAAVQDLPRATVKNLTGPVRPTQRQNDLSQESLVEIAKRTLYG